MTDQRPTNPTRRTLANVLRVLNTIDFHETMAAHASDWLGRIDIAQDTINRHQDAVDEFRRELDQIAVEHGITVDHLTELAQVSR